MRDTNIHFTTQHVQLIPIMDLTSMSPSTGRRSDNESVTLCVSSWMDSQQCRGALAGQVFFGGLGCGVLLVTATAGVEEGGEDSDGESDDGVGDGLDDDDDDVCSKGENELGFTIDESVDGSV